MKCDALRASAEGPGVPRRAPALALPDSFSAYTVADGERRCFARRDSQKDSFAPTWIHSGAPGRAPKGRCDAT